MLSGCFSPWSPKFCYCYCYVVLPGHLSQHAKAATAEGLTFSDPIHKKSARNLNLYNFCYSAKKVTAVSPFTNGLEDILVDPMTLVDPLVVMPGYAW
jgi:hypothetical protein